MCTLIWFPLDGRSGSETHRLSLFPLKLLMSFPSNHVLFCWELPPGVSHLPTSFLPPCQGNAVTRSHNALQLPSVWKHCSGAVSIWHVLKKTQQNKSEINLYYEMLYVNAGRQWGSWGVRDVEVSGGVRWGDTFRRFKLLRILVEIGFICKHA